MVSEGKLYTNEFFQLRKNRLLLCRSRRKFTVWTSHSSAQSDRWTDQLSKDIQIFVSALAGLKDAPPREWNLIYSMNWKLSSVVDAKHTQKYLYGKNVNIIEKKERSLPIWMMNKKIYCVQRWKCLANFDFLQFWHRGPSMVAKYFKSQTWKSSRFEKKIHRNLIWATKANKNQSQKCCRKCWNLNEN